MDNIIKVKEENARLRMLIDEQRERNRHLTAEVNSLKAKEESISSAIIFAMERSNQWDNSMRKLYELDIQRMRLLYARMERVLNELYTKYPELKKESKLKDMVDKFKNITSGADVDYSLDSDSRKQTSEDPIKKLLNNIISYIDDKKEVRTLPRKPGVSTAVDNISQEYIIAPSSSGFNIDEALNPTEDLEDILKSFNLTRDAK